MREVVNPTVQGMIADGIPFTGFLYAGLMIDASGAPKVIEFNVRFGDPETQPVMLRLQSDLVDLVEAAIDGRLDQIEAQWDARPSLGVVLAAKPYPEAPITGDVISGLDDVPAAAKVFHAGTALDAQGQVVSAGDACCAWPHWATARRAGQCLCRRSQGELGQRIPPQRHWLARDRTRE